MTFQQDRSRGGGGAGRCSAVHNNPQSTVLQSCKREIKMWITAVLELDWPLLPLGSALTPLDWDLSPLLTCWLNM